MEFSKYYTTLSVLDRSLYEKKVKSAGVFVDTYTLGKDEISSKVELFPNLRYHDLCNYLVAAPNPEKFSDNGCTQESGGS